MRCSSSLYSADRATLIGRVVFLSAALLMGGGCGPDEAVFEAHRARGSAAWRAGDRAGAIAAWAAAAEWARGAQRPVDEAGRMRAIAQAHLEQDDLAAASDALRRELHLRSALPAAERARSWFSHALLARDQGRLARALTEMDTALTQARPSDALRMRMTRANLLARLGRASEALTEARAILADLPPSVSTATRARAHHLCAWLTVLAALDSGHPPPQGVPHFDAALAGFEGHAADRGAVLVDRAWLAWLQGDAERARADLAASAQAPLRARDQRYALLLDAELAGTSAAFEAVLRDVTDPDVRWRAWYGLGRAQQANGASPMPALRAAVDALRAQAERVDLQTGRGHVLNRGALIDDLLAALIAREAWAEAFALLELLSAQGVRSTQRLAQIERLSAREARRWSQALGAWRSARRAVDAGAAARADLPRDALPAWARAQARRAARLDAAWAALAARLPPTRETTLAAVQAALKPGEAVQMQRGRAGLWITNATVGAATDPRPAAAHVYRVGPTMTSTPRGVSLIPYAGWLTLVPRSTRRPALVVANPDGTLPAASEEGRAVARALAVQPIERPRSGLPARWADARVFHFAGHGRVHPNDPWRAALVLDAQHQVTLTDVLLATPPHLAVLTSCRAGQVEAIEGVGLPTAFLAAGAQAVIASTQPLDDVDARRFSALFYAAGGARRPGAALASARRALPHLKGLQLWGRPAVMDP